MKGLSVLVASANAVLPIMLLMLLGWSLRRWGKLSDDFLSDGNKIVFKYLLPASLFINVYDLESIQDISLDLILFGTVMVFVLFSLGMVTAVLLSRNNSRRSVILQATFRSNMVILGIPLAQNLGSEAALGNAAMLTAFTVMQYNILSVLSFVVFSSDHAGRSNKWKDTFKKIATNPLILAICGGLLCLMLREVQNMVFGRIVFSLKRDLSFLYSSFSYLKSMATPLALLILGGQFVFSAVGHYRKEIIGTVFARVAVSPLIGIGAAVLLSRYTGLIDFGPNEFPALIAMLGSPVAVSSSIMASQMGGDDQLATQLVVWSSICSVCTIFITVSLLMGAGLIVV